MGLELVRVAQPQPNQFFELPQVSFSTKSPSPTIDEINGLLDNYPFFKLGNEQSGPLDMYVAECDAQRQLVGMRMQPIQLDCQLQPINLLHLYNPVPDVRLAKQQLIIAISRAELPWQIDTELVVCCYDKGKIVFLIFSFDLDGNCQPSDSDSIGFQSPGTIVLFAA